MSEEQGRVELVFRALTLKARIAEYSRRLARRALVMIALPVVLVIFVRMSGADDDGVLTRLALRLGVTMIALIVTSSFLAVLVARMPERVVTLDETTIHERVGGDLTERTWKWVVGATEDATRIEIELRPDPQRSFRLTPTKPARLLLDKAIVDATQIARVRELLRARGLLV